MKVAIIGGGFIGLEVAAAARSLGKPVTVIEAGPRLMGRVLAPVVSEYFLQTHIAQGVGFFDHSHLDRSFRILLGMTPTQYQQSVDR